jgi:site-specific recombinase XerD
MPAGLVIYSLRHTYGTRLGEVGADGFAIMRLMGHSSITLSQRYVHPTQEKLARKEGWLLQSIVEDEEAAGH